MSRTDAPRPSKLAEWGDRVPRSLGRKSPRRASTPRQAVLRELRTMGGAS